jgi:hypothetical protein
MPYLLMLISLLNIYALAATGPIDELSLMQACGKQELGACEKLGAYYLAQSKWEKAFIVGEALCSKDYPLGCTFAGSAALAQGKSQQGQSYLNQACDKFEPYSCRSLGRLLQAQQPALGQMYFKRACYYGLKEICQEVKTADLTFSLEARELLEKTQLACKDGETAECGSLMKSIQSCEAPLTKQDCLLLPGQLTIHFRAKLLQGEARLSLMNLQQAQQVLKDDPKLKTYSYDLSQVLKNTQPLEKYQYLVGFMKSCSKKYMRRARFKHHAQEIFPRSYQHLGMRTIANMLTYYNKAAASDCYDPKVGYEAYAVGNLDPLDPTRLDVWKIDQDGRLEHVINGLP